MDTLRSRHMRSPSLRFLGAALAVPTLLLTTTGTPLPGFPGGLLVVHDGRDTPADGDRPSTNFKFLDAGFLR